MLIKNVFSKNFNYKIFVCLLSLSLIVVSISSCKTKSNATNGQESLLKSQRQKQSSEGYVVNEQAYQDQMAKQTKSARKEMKNNKKQSERYNMRKQEFFLIRFFRENAFKRQKKQKG